MDQQLGFTDEEEFTKYLQAYLDRIDSCLQSNEFPDAEKALRELVADILQRRLERLRPVLEAAEALTIASTLLEIGLRASLDSLKDST